MSDSRSGSGERPNVELAHQILKNLGKQLETVASDLEKGGADGARAVGRILELASLPDAASEAYGHSVRLEPNSPRSRGMLVLALMKAKRHDEALEQATILAGQDPRFDMETLLPSERVSALGLLGDVLAVQGRLDAAEQAYRSALEKNPKDNYAAGRLSQLLLQVSGRSAQALQEAIALGKKTEQNPRFHDTRAILRLADSSPGVIPGVAITPITSILMNSVPGRPFVVGGDRRRAVVETSHSWKTELNPEITGLSESQLTQLGEHWATMGREEHAGVGSFSRFVLQLLGLGAPAELVQEATRAMNDEIDHAKLCFGIASAALGHTVGIGSIEIENCLEGSSDPWTVLHATVVEGCVGETASAAIALAARQMATNSCISDVLDRIVADESRHADLAWKFSAWMLARHPDLADKVRQVFSEADAALTTQSESSDQEDWDAALSGFGILSPMMSQQQARTAFYTDVLPRSRALLDPSSAS